MYADSTQDRAIIDLLVGLEGDSFCSSSIKQKSQTQSFSGPRIYHCNSDEEEAGPELDKEEAELSMVMSQQWDNELLDIFSTRQICFCRILVPATLFRD